MDQSVARESALTKAEVLFAATSLQPGFGGIQRVARLMAKVLTQEFADRATVRFLTLHDTAPPPDIPGPVLPHAGSVWRMARNAVRQRGSHLITDACNLGQLNFLPGLQGQPYLTFMYGIEIWEESKPRWVMSAKAADVQIFITEYTRRRAEAVHGLFPRAVVCHLGTEYDAPPPPRPHWPDSTDVLIVGRMFGERFKGHHELIAAWPAVVAAVPTATLRIVGRGPAQQELETLAARSGAGRSIVFEGFVPDDRVDELYARAAVFAMPSRGEGFGLVYVEAMRHGVPVVASIHDAAPEVVIDGEVGYTVDLDELDQLAERLIRLLRNPDLAARLGRAGYDRWLNNYRFSHFRDRFTPILGDFLAR